MRKMLQGVIKVDMGLGKDKSISTEEERPKCQGTTRTRVVHRRSRRGHDNGSWGARCKLKIWVIKWKLWPCGKNGHDQDGEA